MTKMIFVNLPVKDLAAATRFYEAIGCTKNAQFSDEKAASMVWSEAITLQLLTREYFQTFTPKQVFDAHQGAQVLIALTCDSRKGVDATATAGTSAGGTADGRPPIDLGFLYNRAVEDPDGHVLEFVFMDMSAVS